MSEGQVQHCIDTETQARGDEGSCAEPLERECGAVVSVRAESALLYLIYLPVVHIPSMRRTSIAFLLPTSILC